MCSHGSKYQFYSLLGYDATYFGVWIATFRSNLLPPFLCSWYLQDTKAGPCETLLPICQRMQSHIAECNKLDHQRYSEFHLCVMKQEVKLYFSTC